MCVCVYMCGSFVVQFSITVSNLHVIISSISLWLIFFTLKYFDVPWGKLIFVRCFLILDFLLFFWFLNVYFHYGFKYLGWQGSAYVIFLNFSLLAFVRPATHHYNTIRPERSNELPTPELNNQWSIITSTDFFNWSSSTQHAIKHIRCVMVSIV